VNGKAVPFNMKIGEAGEAFFVFETDSDVPDDLITSPLLEPTEPVSPDSLPLEDFGRFGARHRSDLTNDGLGQEPDFLDLNASSTSVSGEASKTSALSNPPHSPGTSLERVGTLSGLVNTRNATMPVFVEAEKEVAQGLHDNPFVSLEISQLTVSYGNRITERMLNEAKLDDEAHPSHFMKDLSASHGNGTGGLSCSISFQCSFDVE